MWLPFEQFNIQRGCRQGDPIAPYLFIICAEILAILIKQNHDIGGIIINGNEQKISQYADDTYFRWVTNISLYCSYHKRIVLKPFRTENKKVEKLGLHEVDFSHLAVQFNDIS